MDLPSYVLIAFAASLCCLWFIFRRFLVKSPLDNIPGPPPPPGSMIMGHIPEFTTRNSWKYWRTLVDTYGPVSQIRGLFGMRLVQVSDPKALYSILIKDAEHYPKKLEPATDMHILIGPGLLTTEGAQNRKQRKLLNPVFSVGHLRNMTHILYGIAHRLHKAIETRIGKDGSEIDVNGWMARTTLEMLGQAGLGYSFDNFIDDSTDAYGESLKMFFPVLSRITAFSLMIPTLSWILPDWALMKLLRLIPHGDVQRMVGISDTLVGRSLEIIKEKKSALLKGDDALVHQVGEGKDIMSLLLKANMIASDAEKHTDQELIAQMSTFILGGMDTTSNALSRILHQLAMNPPVQDKLRAEIVETCGGEDIEYDEIMKLPYLEAVCRETLRVFAPVQMIVRSPSKDMILPVFKPVRGSDGTMMSEVPIPKGTMILLNSAGCNTNKDLWGNDAYEWKPERWLGELPKALDDARVPGVYSNLMTFSGGGRSCIGFKFSQLEMKVVLVVLLSAFKFELTNKPITWNSSAVMYPSTGEESSKPEMFLKLSKVV
ncbi:cytochrome P450 [Trametes gibbosa]|nr:cytochrome P450 [Trametes gibbosa]